MITLCWLDELDVLDGVQLPPDAGHGEPSPGGWSSVINKHLCYEVRGGGALNTRYELLAAPMTLRDTSGGTARVQLPLVSN